MKMQKVEKGVPVPPRFKYPLPEMEVGDSVFIKADDSKSPADLQNNINAAMYYYSNKTNKKFTSMIMYNENGVRVWRIK